MDHLPLMIGCREALPEVPCICDPYCFDGKEFETFPARKGFRVRPEDGYARELLNGDGTLPSPKQYADILQAWLFFGVLVELFKVSNVLVDPMDFVRREGHNTYITMRCLPAYLGRWKQHEVVLSRKDQKLHFRRQQEIIGKALVFRTHNFTPEWWLPNLSFEPDKSHSASLPFSIEMSMVILEETLDRASRRNFGIDHNGYFQGTLNTSLTRRLEHNGWCPSEVSLATATLDHTSTLLANQLHRQATRADHSRCSSTKCLAFDIDVETYETRHTLECTGCTHIAIDSHEVASVLHQNKIPRVCVQVQDVDKDLRVKLTIKDSGVYIAISHVWSDGLGNAKANSLPACQLLRIRRLVLALDVDFDGGVPAIWIDTLLVPVKKGLEKRLALSRLFVCYQKAAKVLVLDSDLLQASQSCSREERFLRVFFSTWMRRLWTLEEGVLSRSKLAFQFRDGTVSIDGSADSTYQSLSITRTDHIAQSNLSIYIPKISNDSYQSSGSNAVVAKILPALQYRSTTKAIDEPLCIAHILELDASRLVSIDDVDHRMKALLEMLAEHKSKFPTRFLFTHEPKLQLSGFQWAPRSFMALDPEDTAYLNVGPDKDWTTYTDHGLLVSDMTCFVLDFGCRVLKKVTFVKLDLTIFALVPVPIGENCRDGVRFFSTEVSEKAFDVDTSRRWSKTWQTMLNVSPSKVAVLCSSDSSYGVVVSGGNFSSEIGSPIYARLMGQVYLYEIKTKDKNFPVLTVDRDVIKFTAPDWDCEEMERQMQEAFEAQYNSETAHFLHGILGEPSQRWCIG